jgi:type IV pilus assembly protein PilW
MNRRAVRLERQTGWGLAEMMVGVMISMIAVLVICESFSAFEAQKRTTTSAIAAQEAGLLALSAIERDARVAGYGLVVNNALACTTINIYQAGALAAIPAMPIAIADGGATASDSITFMYSTSSFAATPSALTIDAPTSTPVVMVGNTANNAAFTAGDFIMLAQPTMGKPCARLRVTGTVAAGSDVQILHASSDPSNPPSAVNLFPTAPSAGYTASTSDPSVAINMGAMVNSTYSVLNGSLAYMDNTRGAGPITLSTGIVSLQAQYGVASAGSQTVNEWVDAKGSWATPSAVDIARIKAVRIAIIARSALLEKDNVTQPCVNSAGTNKGPCAWLDNAASPAPLIDLSADPNWQRYRYRVYETIIPLRNIVWGNL